MKRVPFGRSNLDPRRTNTFLDSCAFDPKYTPEDEAARAIQKLGDSGDVSLVVAHSVQKEIDHPNTPEDVKRAAESMIYTKRTGLIREEEARKAAILLVLTGNGNPEKYAADAAHIFEAGKYGGYFVTTDARILDKRGDLAKVAPAVVLRPSEWLKVFSDAAEGPPHEST